MKGRLILALIAMPFAGIAAWMALSVAGTFLAAAEMREWLPVSAIVQSGGYTTDQGDDSTTYRAYASYTYEFAGQRYSGNRVQISRFSDNIGDFQQELGRKLSAAASQNGRITVFVNPDVPTESIVDPGIRWGLAGFKMIFVLVFGGIGAGLLYAVFRSPAEKDATRPEFVRSPWLLNDDWQTATIRSNSKHAMWGIWAFAALWNLVSAPTPFIAWQEFNAGNTIALVALLFPVVGIGLLTWAVRKTLEWRRFGPSPVTLDPFPGSIGGHVGGRIETRVPYATDHRFRLTLSCVYSYETGSGEDRRRRENLLWDKELVASTAPTATGTRLGFRFDVPAGLMPADADRSSDDYHLWRLHVRSDLPGTDFDRDFDIPVYATATQSVAISEREASAEIEVSASVYDDAIRDLVRVTTDGLRKKLVFPMGRHVVSNGAAILIGSVFAAAGWYLVIEENATIFGSIFGGVGGLVAIAALYMLLKSLHVTLDGNTITSQRRWSGLPISTKSMRRDEFVRFVQGVEMQSQSGAPTMRYYTISGKTRSGNKVLLGEGFQGSAEADAATRFLAQELGLTEKDAGSDFELDPSLFAPEGSELISS